jgi:hypothetical protein
VAVFARTCRRTGAAASVGDSAAGTGSGGKSVAEVPASALAAAPSSPSEWNRLDTVRGDVAGHAAAPTWRGKEDQRERA